MKSCEMKGIGQLVTWRSPGWARFEVMEPWQIWSSANHTPLWFEEAIGKRRVRISYCGATPDVEEAMARLARWWAAGKYKQ